MIGIARGTNETVQQLDMDKTTAAWAGISNTVFVPHSEGEYQRLVSVLDGLTDEVGENEDHALASMMEVLSVLIENYEDEHVPELLSSWKIKR